MEGFETKTEGMLSSLPDSNEPKIGATLNEENPLININGLSDEELKDVNKIIITISDTSAPVIVLFGPASCGKTMTMVRLARYLQGQGYLLIPDRTFRPSYDQNYKNLCDNFSSIVNSNDAASRTDNISFFLVKVVKDGKTICQILEGPGELYFNPNKATQEWPTYVHYLLNSTQLRKVFIPFVEPNFGDVGTRRNYVSTLNQLKMSTDKQKYVFLYNKIDKTPFVIAPGKVHINHAMHQVRMDYPDIFARFMNTNPITSLWRPNNFDFVPFQTGTYTQSSSGSLAYIQGSDRYPQILWETLLRCIRG